MLERKLVAMSEGAFSQGRNDSMQWNGSYHGLVSAHDIQIQGEQDDATAIVQNRFAAHQIEKTGPYSVSLHDCQDCHRIRCTDHCPKGTGEWPAPTKGENVFADCSEEIST